MGGRTYRWLDEPRGAEALGCWGLAVAGFTAVEGHTAFGDFLLRDPDTGEYALLTTVHPGLYALGISDRPTLEAEFLGTAEVAEEILRPAEVEALEARLGPLAPGQVYAPEPFPSLGGSGAPETCEIVDVWAFADLVGRSIGVGEDEDDEDDGPGPSDP